MHLLLRSKHIAPKPRIARAPELVSRISGCLDSPVVTRRHYFLEVMGSMNPLDLSFTFFFFLFSSREKTYAHSLTNAEPIETQVELQAMKSVYCS